MKASNRVPMVDARQRVTAEIVFSEDIGLPGMLHGKILRSLYPHARISHIDAHAAEALPGVAAVITGPDLAADPGLNPIYGPQIKDQPLVALDRVRYVGDPVAAVAAVDPETAAEALTRIDVAYEPLPAVYDEVEAAQPGAPKVHDLTAGWVGTQAYFGMRPRIGTNICHHYRLRQGDVERGFAQADHVFERTFRAPAAQHVTMEPHASLAVFEGEELVVYTGTQSPFNVRDVLAEIFQMPPGQVSVVVPALGGGFGAKVFPRLEPVAAALARKTGRPVRIALERDEEFLTLNRHPATVTLKLGVSGEGLLVAKQVEAYWGTGAYADSGPGVAQKGGYASVGPYRIPHVSVDSYCVYTNLPPNGAFRGYAVTQVVWASECMMDEAARALGLDPLAFRQKNLLQENDRFATGERMRDVAFSQCLAEAAAAIDWGPGGAEPSLKDAGPRVRGKGLAVLLKGMTTPSRSEAAVEIDRQGQITVRAATIDMGQGARTVLAQFAAEALNVPYQTVRLADPDTAATPYDNRTTSSRSTYMMSHAVGRAGREVRRQVLDLAGEMLEADPADLVLEKGRVYVAGSPDRGLGLAEVVQHSGQARLRGEGRHENQGGLDPDTGRGIASSHWHQGAVGVEIEVDTETGLLRLLRCRPVVYAGRVVNRFTAELQTEGGAIMGLGSALFEEILFSDGQVGNGNLSDYMLPSFLDVPSELTCSLIERPGAEVHGLGETALPLIPAAVGNALADALGIRIYDLPLTPEKILRALKQIDPAGEAA
ncbi:MAG: xanthine dehydrogenase family protein molybdopterin-binding subunit [Anaerolineae bacterium]